MTEWENKAHSFIEKPNYKYVQNTATDKIDIYHLQNYLMFTLSISRNDFLSCREIIFNNITMLKLRIEFIRNYAIAIGSFALAFIGLLLALLGLLISIVK